MALVIGIWSASPARKSESGILWSDALRARTAILAGRSARPSVNRLHSLGDVSFEHNVALAAWLKENVADEDPIFIWGFEPMVYDMARRTPASRYVYNVPQRLDWPGQHVAQQRLIDELDAAQPSAVVVVRHDVFPKVTGDARDSLGALRRFEQLGEFIDEGYSLTGEIEDFMIYERIDRGRRD